MNSYKNIYLNALILKDLLVTILIILLAVFYCVTLTSVPEKNIEKLKQKGLLKRIGPAKGGHWEVVNGKC